MKAYILQKLPQTLKQLIIRYINEPRYLARISSTLIVCFKLLFINAVY